MQALVIIAMLGVISFLGVGYMSNDVELWIQSFGVGDGIIESPVENTELSIIIERVDTPEGPDDFITTCEFTSLDTDLLIGTKLYCKLYDGVDLESAFIIATGFVMLDQLVQMGNVIPIQITDLSFEDSNNMDFVANVLVEVQEP